MQISDFHAHWRGFNHDFRNPLLQVDGAMELAFRDNQTDQLNIAEPLKRPYQDFSAAKLKIDRTCEEISEIAPSIQDANDVKTKLSSLRVDLQTAITSAQSLVDEGLKISTDDAESDLNIALAVLRTIPPYLSLSMKSLNAFIKTLDDPNYIGDKERTNLYEDLLTAYMAYGGPLSSITLVKPSMDIYALIDSDIFSRVWVNLIQNYNRYANKSSLTISIETAKCRVARSLDPKLTGEAGKGFRKHLFDFLLYIKNLWSSAGKEAKTAVEPTIYEESENVVVKFSDTGPGIPDENKSRVFDEGFTTGGNGIGLFNVKRIVEAHNGTIQVEDTNPTSPSNKGATFIITLPKA